MLSARNKVGIIFFPAYDWAISPTHPEREERLLYTQDQLREEGIFDIENIQEFKPDIAQVKDVQRTHFCFPNVQSVVTESHMISAGGAIKAAKLVLENKVDKAFALVRPPGHHAMKVIHGNRGFCNINNEAIMIEYIRHHYGDKKIAIVDTDCHHGDGTQDIYWHDPNVLFISMHQDGRTLYPGTGFIDELGGPNAFCRNINIPLPPETSDDGILYILDHVILPILQDFKPDIIINSAGQDNHYTDPITNMNFSAQGYATLNERLNPDICVLEGGYSIQTALPYVNLGIILAMAGIDYSHVCEPDYDPERWKQSESVTNYIATLSDDILDYYFNRRTGSMPDRIVGQYQTRQKSVYYDTDNIQDSQTESVRICNDCPGLLKVESVSSINPLSLGIEIPFNACDMCLQEGLRLIEESKNSTRYYFKSIINRREI